MNRSAIAEATWAAVVALLLAGGAALGVGNIFADSLWVTPTLVAITSGVGLALAGRLASLPTPVTVVGSLAVGAAWLAAWWPLSASLPWSRRAAALWAGLDLANQEVMTQVAPAPTLSGLVLITVAGCFVVGLAVTLLLQRGAVLGAILVAVVLWVVPLSVPVPDRQVVVPTLALLLPAALALATIGRDDASGAPARVRAAAFAGAVSVALVATPVAAALPWYDAPALVDLQSLGGALDASQPVVDVGDQLHQPSPFPVMTVRTATPTYLRTAALEVFDGSTWRVGTDIDQPEIPTDDLDNPRDGVDDEPAPATSIDGRWQITSLGLRSAFLPIINQPRRVTTPTDGPALAYNPVGEYVRVNSITALEDSTPSGADYVVEAAIPSPTAAQLAERGVDDDVVDAMTQLPTGQEVIVDVARDLVDEAGAQTAIDQVITLQEHFAGPDSDYAYTTNVPTLRGSQALQTFVLDEQQGYCEYYATAMTVMLRGLGIPARVATGYLPGRELSPPGPEEPGLYQVSSTDAHAWVEVAFEDFGWVTFDPTPRSDTADLRATRSSLVNLAATGSVEVPPVGPEDIPRPTDPAVPAPGPDPSGAGAGGGVATSASVAWIVGVVAIVLLAAIVLARRQRLLAGGNEPAVRIRRDQQRLLATAGGLGLGRRDDETMHEVARRWASDNLFDAGSTTTVARLSSLAAFGDASTLQPTDAMVMGRAVDSLVEQMRARASTSQRVLERIRTTLGV